MGAQKIQLWHVARVRDNIQPGTWNDKHPRFESEDLTGVIELQTLLGISKLTHQMLSEHITLDGYDSMFREANNSVKSQVVHHFMTIEKLLQIFS